MKKQLIGWADLATIEVWKKANPAGVFALEGKESIGYFKNPTREDLNCVMSKMDSERPLEMFEDLAHTLWLGGDTALIENESSFLGLVLQLKKKMDGDAVKLVNL